MKIIPKSYIDVDNPGTLGSLHSKFHSDCLTRVGGVREETYRHDYHSKISTYASIHLGIMCRCHDCHHMAVVWGNHRGPASCQNMGALELVPLWASHLHPEQASSPADQLLQKVSSVE